MGHDLDFTFSLYGRDGRRKYVSPDERTRLIEVARNWADRNVGTLCLTLVYSGCRISEALALTSACVDLGSGTIAVRCLKKRHKMVVREIPVPAELLLRLVPKASRYSSGPLFGLSRGRAWQLIKLLMHTADIASGPHACPKGLRHGFGVHAIRSGIPLHLLQRWLGHASLTTTAIYAQVMGLEEREIAERMWRDP